MESKAFFSKGIVSETDEHRRCMFISSTSKESEPVDVDCFGVT